MDFQKISLPILLSSTLLLTACGAGDSSNNSSVSTSRSTYTGNEAPAELDEDIGLFYVAQVLKRLNNGLISEFLRYDELLLNFLRPLTASNQTEYRESRNCDDGNYNTVAQTNTDFERFSLTIEYNHCELNKTTSDGDFSATIALDDHYFSYQDILELEVEYQDFEIDTDGSSFYINGEETKTLTNDGNSHRFSQTLFLQENDEQTLLSNLNYERLKYPTWLFGGFESLSGDYYDNEYGKVSLSLESDSSYDDNLIVLTGNNDSTIKIGFNNATLKVEIAYDYNGDQDTDDFISYSLNDIIQMIQ